MTAAAAAQDEQGAAAKRTGMASVLVIDDDNQFREFLRRTLHDAGHQVAEATNGVEGVKRFREQRCELVVTDIVMPVQGGIETIMQIKSICPKSRILGISGGGMAGNLPFLRKASKLGADAWLAKPFFANELLDAVNQLLAEARDSTATGE